jgi:CheY-like chemotaxis protein
MSSAPAQPGRARRILLVDDDKSYTAFFKEFLLNYRAGAWIVHTADHYAPALACLKQGGVDLVVMDINMPIMDGRQLLTLFKRTHPEIQVVILTGEATPEARAECLRNGATLFFNKAEVANNLEQIYVALESLADAPVEGFRGMLRQVTLPDVLQMECLGRKSSVLEVASPNAVGQIVIEDGSIIHAEVAGKLGESALFQLLGLKGGEFKLKPFSQPPRHTIDGHWESLVMEAARLCDEAAATPPAEAPPQLTPAPGLQSAEPSAIAPGSALPVAQEPEVLTVACQVEEIVLCSSTGDLLYEWQSPNVNRRVLVLDSLFKASAAFAKTMGLSQGERLEVFTPEGRIMLLLRPDRRVLVRSSNEPAPS